jgi:hypothetical protein
MSLFCHETLDYYEDEGVARWNPDTPRIQGSEVTLEVEDSFMEEIDYVLFERVKAATVFYRRILSAYKKNIGADISQFIDAHNAFLDDINHTLPFDELPHLYIRPREFPQFSISMPFTERELVKKINHYMCFYRTILKCYKRDTQSDLTPFIDAHNNFLTSLQKYVSDKRLQKLVLTIDGIDVNDNLLINQA